MRAAVRMLDEHRLHLQDGPIDLVIEAHGGKSAADAAREAARTRFATVLDELCGELALLRSHANHARPPSGPVALRMWKAVLPFAGETFITPMAAVAGSVADEVLAAMLAAGDGLTRAWVNNGGDIALHLAPGQHASVGLVDRPDRPSLFGSARLSAGAEIGGIATSGWRGRSFSLGIADAVTVLAASSAEADAAATIIANAVDLPEHPGIVRVPARSLQPDNDLGDRLVTRAVGPLSKADVAQALAAGLAVAEREVSRRHIAAAALHLAGATRVTRRAPAFANPLTEPAE
jgi:hypothetical protein